MVPADRLSHRRLRGACGRPGMAAAAGAVRGRELAGAGGMALLCGVVVPWGVVAWCACYLLMLSHPQAALVIVGVALLIAYAFSLVGFWVYEVLQPAVGLVLAMIFKEQAH